MKYDISLSPELEEELIDLCNAWSYVGGVITLWLVVLLLILIAFIISR